jgi:hypothetical protein
MRNLTYKQRLFVAAYLGKANGNGAEAVRLAGYATKWPDKIAAQLLGNARVRALISARVECAAMSAAEILARLAEIASANQLDFMKIDARGEWTVDLRLAKKRGLGHLIKRLKRTERGTEVELHDPVVALLKLGDHHNLFDQEKPPDISLVELAKKLREKYDRDRSGGLGHPHEPT